MIKGDPKNSVKLVNISSFFSHNSTALKEGRKDTSEINIFAKTPCINEINELGPRFDKQGHLLKYSVVGKPEWFLKLSNFSLKSMKRLWIFLLI